MKYDLHVHTTCSDGKYTRLELLKKGNDIGLEYMCFTDHNYIDDDIDLLNKQYFDFYNSEQNVKLFIGTELDISEFPRLHILGYDLDNFTELKSELINLEHANTEICRELVDKIKYNYNISIPFSELEQMTKNGNVTKNIVVQWLIDHEYAKNVYDAGMRYTSKYSPCYVKRKSLKLEKAFSLIKKANGIIVMAHPSSLKLSNDELNSFVRELKILGLDGIEVFNADKTNYQQLAFYQYLASNVGLLQTSGSDFHRETETPVFGLDNNFSDDFIKILKRRK